MSIMDALSRIVAEILRFLSPRIAVVLAGFGMAALGLYVLWRAQNSKTNPIDLADLLVDRDGHTSNRQTSELVALLVTSWVLLWLAVTDRLIPEFYWAYLFGWALRTVSGPVLNGWAALLQARAGNAPREEPKP